MTSGTEEITCFARDPKTGRCTILYGCASDRKCAKCRFRKEERLVTGGRKYPGEYSKKAIEDPIHREPVPVERVRQGECNKDPHKDREEDLQEKKIIVKDVLKKQKKPKGHLVSGAAGLSTTGPCRMCIYSTAKYRQSEGLAAGVTCSYILVTGHRRPCRKEQCEELGIFQPREKGQVMSGWKTEHAAALKRAKAEREKREQQDELILESFQDDDDDYNPMSDPSLRKLLVGNMEAEDER